MRMGTIRIVRIEDSLSGDRDGGICFAATVRGYGAYVAPLAPSAFSYRSFCVCHRDRHLSFASAEPVAPHSLSRPMTSDAIAPDLELRLLGGIELRGPSTGGADKVLAQSKAVAHLAFLALSPDRRFQRRDLIMGLLWPELDQPHARAALRKAVYEVRGALGADIVASRGDDELAILPETLRCDVEAFNSACDRGRLVQALELYRGE